MSRKDKIHNWPHWSTMPAPLKALASAVILVMAIAMAGALGQIVIHDLIPTFSSQNQRHADNLDNHGGDGHMIQSTDTQRGDLFAESPAKPQPQIAKPFYKQEQFVWTLKWTHIHLFGMNMIFIFMGAIALFLNLSLKARTWLIVLPFIGVIIDIATMWLKAYVSPAFFWLHLPGGGLFGAVFVFVSIRGLIEMWLVRDN